MSELEKKLEAALRKNVVEVEKLRSKLDKIEQIQHEPIAVIGMSCRFPGHSNSPEEYWKLLYNGTDGITEVPKERWDIDSFYDPDPDAAGKMITRNGGFISDFDLFDAEFFGISPREAQELDPQQRLLLEITWQALESAGIAPESLKNSQTGVFIGACLNDYCNVIQKLGFDHFKNHTAIGTVLNALNGRISYTLGLLGPSMTVDTACSSSLVSLHLACTSLQRGECQLAIAGGVNLMLSPAVFVMLSRAKMLSPDGHCKTFDASGDGYARGEGVGVILLKRLSDAQKDRDNILAVIRATAVNQDGPSSGLTVPNRMAQVQLIEEALNLAKLKPTEISYMEAHGTGTQLGDPIEVSGIKDAYGKGRNADHPLLLGSAKSNIGHLEGAAGIASVIKVILSLQHKIIPPNLHFKNINPKINLEAIPAKIITSPTAWDSPEGVLRKAGVSSFGFTGTNAHVIIEEAPVIPINKAAERTHHMLTLSATTQMSLERFILSFGKFLDTTTEHLADIAYTMNAGRNHFPFRIAVIAKDIEELKKKLASHDYKVFTSEIQKQKRMIFTYQDQGSFKRQIQQDLITIEIGPDIEWEKLFGELVKDYGEGFTIDWKSLDAPYERKKVQLPTYPFQHQRYPVESLTLDDDRSAHSIHPLLGEMQVKPNGGIEFFGRLDLDVLPYLKDHQVYGNVIYPGAAYIEMMLAGAMHALEWKNIYLTNVSVEAALQFPNDQHVETLLTMSPLENGFHVTVYSRPKKNSPWQSHAKGTLVQSDVKQDIPASNLEEIKERCQTPLEKKDFYQFVNKSGIFYGENFQTIDTLYVGKQEALVELKCLNVTEGYLAHPSLLDGCFQSLMTSLIKNDEKSLYLPVAYDSFVLYESLGNHLFAHWKETQFSDVSISGNLTLFNPSGKLLAIVEGFHCRKTTEQSLKQMLAHETNYQDWLYEWTWQEHTLNSVIPDSIGHWLILNDGKVSDVLRHLFESRGGTCHTIPPNEHPKTKEAFIEWISQIGIPISGIIHASTTHEVEPLSAESIRKAQRTGTESYLHLVQALVQLQDKFKVPLFLITQQITSGNLPNSPLLALFKTISGEHPEIEAKLIDLSNDWDSEKLFQALFAKDGETILSIKKSNCYVPRFIHSRLSPVETPLSFKPDSTYLITGGAGELGLTITRWLIEKGAKNLVLTGRKDLESGLLEDLRNLGASVTYESVDISNEQAVSDLIGRIKKPLKGIFHLAGVLDDATLLNQNWSRFEKVFAAKVYGSYSLHQYSKDLDYFVLFSSSASSLGSPGQSNYAAANGFMDALCEFRHKQGLPGVSLSWGPWAEVGMAKALTARHAKGGLIAIHPKDAIHAMEAAILSNRAHITIMDVQWKNFIKQMIAPPPWLQAFTQQEVSQDNLLAQLESAKPTERLLLIKKFVSNIVRTVLGLPLSQALDEKRGFFDMGLDSLMAVELKNQLQIGLGKTAILGATVVFDQSNLEKMTNHIAQLLKIEANKDKKREPISTSIHPDEPIAIIGMGCRFPGGANSPEAYWDLLNQGRDAITEVPASRWNADQYYDPNPETPGKMISKLGGFLDIDVSQFDAPYFRFNPKEAKYTDPQQRLLLEVSHEALESAGIAPASLDESLTGVFIGIWRYDYSDLFTETRNMDLINRYSRGILNSFAAGRLSYFYGLQGPSFAIDTACSSATVAICDACQNLRNGDCHLALAGGVNLILSPIMSISTSQAGLMAADGHCKSFDASADGYIRGEGCGIIILKRLHDALRDGDQILAVIKGSGVNHGGASSGPTVPHAEAQEALIRKVLAKSKLKPEDIDYVEAMATGTPVGDPIEVKALGAVYGQRDPAKPFKMASVKPNIGHLESASGIASVIKVILALQHESLPAHLNLKKLNPAIDLNFPVEIITANQPWKKGEHIRRAAINSFGVSGTNAHLILEEAPKVEPKVSKRQERRIQILTLSAKTEAALTELIQKYRAYAQSTSDNLTDIAFTANTGRNPEKFRTFFIAHTLDELLKQLESGKGQQGEVEEDKKYRITFQYVDQGPYVIKEEGSLNLVIEIGPDANWSELLEKLGNYYIHGADIDWVGFDDPFARKKVLLPTYPFQRKRYWCEFDNM